MAQVAVVPYMPPKASSSRHARSPSSSAREEAALGLSALVSPFFALLPGPLLTFFVMQPGSPALTASRRRRRRGDDEQPEESTPTGGASAATTAGGPSPYASPTRRSFAAGPSAAAGPSNVPEQSPQQQQQQQQRTPRGAVSAVASSPGALSAVEELSPGPETKLSTSAASGADKTVRGMPMLEWQTFTDRNLLGYPLTGGREARNSRATSDPEPQGAEGVSAASRAVPP